MGQPDQFEQSFDEQLKVIQAEELAVAEPDHLPEGLSVVHSDTPFCFKWPQIPDVPADSAADILRNLTWMPDSRKRAAAIMRDYMDAEATRHAHLSQLSDKEALGAATILAILVCAEESAVSVFNHECARLEEKQIKANTLALREIETEERGHNWLIHRARELYPEPDDLASLRRRTRRMFMKVASRDMGEHFARISGLDSGVCISLTALLGSDVVAKSNGYARLLRHIRRDESTHVKKSRIHAQDMGFDYHKFGEAYEMSRGHLVKLMETVADAFEDLGVCSDRLFKRLRYHNASRNSVEDLYKPNVPVP